MPPKFKRHLNDDEVTGSVRSERRNLLEEDSDEEEDFFLRGPTGPRFGGQNDKIRQYVQVCMTNFFMLQLRLEFESRQRPEMVESKSRPRRVEG
uniref:Vesicle-associated membrane protein 4 n=2 Tax=Cyprinus carpio TaxID=7962 RepID=A0A8C2CHM2_CYPCA